jgi:hypothetical protein
MNDEKDLEPQDDVEGHKLSREVWAQKGADDGDDVEGHKLSRE